MNTRLFLSSLLAGSLLLALSGCDRTDSLTLAPGADDNGFTAPSELTGKHNQNVAGSLPLSDQMDFELARRGLIARPSSLRVQTPEGDLAWDQNAYDFIEGEAPQSVNPSLWRQAQLNGIHGLFEVSKGIYQLRGFDLANVTLIDTDNGWILVDPLTTEDTARRAMAFAREHLGDKLVKAVVFTHSHVDHFGGVLGALRESELDDLQVIAPKGFMEEAVSENLMAGVAMQRRATFMYGRNLPISERGHVDTGLGKEPAKGGRIGILEPTHIVGNTGDTLIVDGVEMVFQYAPGSEAPAEFTFYLPKHRAFCGAEVMSRNMHNVYTLRGAKVRNALAWSGYIDEAIDLFGRQADVYFASHHWPLWGTDEIVDYLKKQRDTYKFIHDQTLRLANQGYTPREISEQLELPSSLRNSFGNRGYYGTLSHNAKAVYQWYFGWYDGNPANLNPHTPSESGRRYVEFMGGAEALLQKAQASFDDGDYRWVAEVLNHLVFAEPDNRQAKALLAKTYDQLGYQAESGPWRDVYLTAAYELRHGAPQSGVDLSDAEELIAEVPTPLFFDNMAASLNGEKADGADHVINVRMTDTDENYVLWIENAVLHHKQRELDPAADAGIEITRELFLQLVTGQAGMKDTLFSDQLSVNGSKMELLSFFSMFDPTVGNFNIVTP
ncbi:MBL fold metallo-hydrolase [Pseudomaricurvus alkylphenolicus]|uniref:alkyl/aryl-sulfatase n=1 Tax=Pseudomaricurvus alkylphenolicus TaxID=1306991 RepID=UPI00141F8250|nr:alkyl sulfatase dimerization domain-containing protein [Pseudomaricurvus alkylphenolicus]NIB43026.1 MBL fold metallo-hydrolase [Pseudomaricurvus alkylphenolicus]